MDCALRLSSGRLGVRTNGYWCVSADEGAAWPEPSEMISGGGPYFDTMIQTSGGRLILPMVATSSGHDGMRDQALAQGTLDGEPVEVEGHGQVPESDSSWCLCSDDEGETWARSDGDVFVRKDDGYGGMWPIDEPNVVELRDDLLDLDDGRICGLKGCAFIERNVDRETVFVS